MTTNKAINRDVALHVLQNLKSGGAEGPFDRGDIAVALDNLEITQSDANIDAVLAAQEVCEQSRSAEEGSARMRA